MKDIHDNLQSQDYSNLIYLKMERKYQQYKQLNKTFFFPQFWSFVTEKNLNMENLKTKLSTYHKKTKKGLLKKGYCPEHLTPILLRTDIFKWVFQNNLFSNKLQINIKLCITVSFIVSVISPSISHENITQSGQQCIQVQSNSSSLAKGYDSGPPSLHPWRIQNTF